MSGGFNDPSVSSEPPVLPPRTSEVVEQPEPDPITTPLAPKEFSVLGSLIAVGQSPLPVGGIQVFRSPSPN